MAVIGKIRKRSGLLIFIIGISILGFLIMDATNSQTGVFSSRKDYVGKVNGTKVRYEDFERKVSETTELYEEQMRGAEISDEMRNSIRQQTWNEMVNEIIFSKVYKKLGLNVTPDELTELTMGEYASPYIKNDQTFRDPNTGQFSKARVQMFINNLDRDPEGVPPGTVRKQWLRFERTLKMDHFRTKYEDLISKALTVPDWMAEMAYYDQARTADIRYVMLPYSDVKEEEAKPTDEELKEYLKKNPKVFEKNEEVRRIQYVSFDIVPSAADSARVIRELEERRAEFAAKTTAAEDSLFVKLYSEIPFDDVFYTKDAIVSPVKDSFFTLPVRSLIGPYLDGNSYKIAKISDRKMISDSLKIREIKISFSGVKTQEEANVRIQLVDSIFRAIDSLKADFAALAAAYSDDALSKAQGGVVGWVKPSERGKEYSNFLFYRAVKGKYYKYPSQTDNAWYIVQILEDKPSKQGVQVAYLSRKILPSQETQNTIYAKAAAFAADNQSGQKFTEAAKKLNVRTAELTKESYTVNGLKSTMAVIKWAFGAKQGEVSPPISNVERHIVAYLESITPKGLPPVDAVKDLLVARVTQEKKYRILAKKITDAGANNIEALANKLNKSAMDATAVSFNSANIGGAYEPNVAAVAVSTPKGAMSRPIQGNMGVYVVQPVNINEPQKITDYSPFAVTLQNTASGKSRLATEALKKLANIKDERFEFYNN
ncbi:MAG: SurA N-terminal domain-containing protein [Chitinophagales bacterium]|nr:SurA N-terminal domain-containing protein [Chitinophagales bacterium]MDW8417835.1 SurA N-terminal domain-containing protein [Chitinophagales bacterium]